VWPDATIALVTPDEVLRQIVQPALDALTRPGEVTSVKAEERSDGRVEVELEFGGESFSFYAWQPDVSIRGRTWLGMFASDLQDFIAEIRYAWGTLRTYPDEWGS
jgi:hypothetical protein